MKYLITVLLAFVASVSIAQNKSDTTKRYVLTEPEAILLSNILSASDNVAGSSDKISANQYKELHGAILKLDSVIKKQYLIYHPQTKIEKKP